MHYRYYYWYHFCVIGTIIVVLLYRLRRVNKEKKHNSLARSMDTRGVLVRFTYYIQMRVLSPEPGVVRRRRFVLIYCA